METIKKTRMICDFLVPDDQDNNNQDESNLIWHVCKFCKVPYKTKQQLNLHKRKDHFQELREIQRRKKRVQEAEEEELRQRLGTYYDIENELESEFESESPIRTTTRMMNIQNEDQMVITHTENEMKSTPVPVIVSNDALDNRGFEFSTVSTSPQTNMNMMIEQDQEQYQYQDQAYFEVIDLTENEEENSSSSFSSFSSSPSLHFPPQYSSNSSTGLLKALLSNNKDLEVVVQKDEEIPQLQLQRTSPKTEKTTSSSPQIYQSAISLLLQQRDWAFESQIKKYLNMKSDNININKSDSNNSNSNSTNLTMWHEEEEEKKSQSSPAQSIKNNHHNNNNNSILRKVLTKPKPNPKDKTAVKRQMDRARTMLKKYNSQHNNNNNIGMNIYPGKLDIKCKLCGGYFSGVRGLKRHLEISHKFPNPNSMEGIIRSELNKSRKICHSPLNNIEGLVEHVGKEHCPKKQQQQHLPPPPPLLLCGVPSSTLSKINNNANGQKRNSSDNNIIRRNKPPLKMFGDSIQSSNETNNNSKQNFNESSCSSNSDSSCSSRTVVSPISYNVSSLPNYRGHNSDPTNLNTGKLSCVNCSQNFSDVNEFARHIIRCM